MRLPNFSAVLRTVGLGGVLAGCVMAVRGLSAVWAVDGPREGVLADRSGWSAMAWGDLAIVAACALSVGLVLALCVGTGSRRAMRGAGVGALLLLTAALGTTAYVWWSIGLDFHFSFFDDAGDTLRAYSRGPGAGETATGLVVAMSGAVVALAGRATETTRARSRRRAHATTATANAAAAERQG